MLVEVSATGLAYVCGAASVFILPRVFLCTGCQLTQRSVCFVLSLHHEGDGGWVGGGSDVQEWMPRYTT